MPSTVYYDIHGLIRLRVDAASSSLAREFETHLGAFKVNSLDGEPDVVVSPYAEAPSIRGDSCASGRRYSAGQLDDREHRFRVNVDALPFRVFADRLELPVNLLIHLALLHRGATFVHAAGIRLDGESHLLPAFGNIGKTTTVVEVLRRGGQVFGDDLCILMDGNLLSYPQRLSLTDEVMELAGFQTADARHAVTRNARLQRLRRFTAGRSPLPLKALDRVLLHFFVPPVHIPFEDVFGDGCVATRTPLRKVAYLDRTELVDRLSVEQADAAWMVARCNPILWLEWHGSAAFLDEYDAHSGGIISGLRDRSVELMAQAFAQTENVRIQIPLRFSPWELQTDLLPHLQGETGTDRSRNGITD